MPVCTRCSAMITYLKLGKPPLPALAMSLHDAMIGKQSLKIGRAAVAGARAKMTVHFTAGFTTLCKLIHVQSQTFVYQWNAKTGWQGSSGVLASASEDSPL